MGSVNLPGSLGLLSQGIVNAREPMARILANRGSRTPHPSLHDAQIFARRPWNVFNELISHYSTAGDIVLDPFCGGGVTVVESLKLGRRAVGVDANPLATYVTEMECKPLNLHFFQQALLDLSQKVELEIPRLYRTKCARCGSEVADWIEWDEQQANASTKIQLPEMRDKRQENT